MTAPASSSRYGAALERVRTFLRVLDQVGPDLRENAVGKILLTTGSATPLYLMDLRELCAPSEIPSAPNAESTGTPTGDPHPCDSSRFDKHDEAEAEKIAREYLSLDRTLISGEDISEICRALIEARAVLRVRLKGDELNQSAEGNSGPKLKRLREAWEAMVAALYPFTHKREWNSVMVELDGAINDFLSCARSHALRRETWGMNMPPLQDMSDEMLARYILKNLHGWNCRDVVSDEESDIEYLACMLKEHRQQCTKSATGSIPGEWKDALRKCRDALREAITGGYVKASDAAAAIKSASDLLTVPMGPQHALREPKNAPPERTVKDKP